MTTPNITKPSGFGVDPGEGWRLLNEGEPLQEGDGFLSPYYHQGTWIDFVCRPDKFRGAGMVAKSWPWRRRMGK